MKIYNFMKKLIVFIILSCVSSSCIVVGFALANENGSLDDVYEAVPIPGIDTSLSVRKKALVEFGFKSYNEENILQYNSPEPRLKYCFNVLARTNPTVKLNSFSFTDAKGDTIPSVLYYRTQNRVVIIDTLPIVFTAEIIKEKGIYGPRIFAECSKSEKSINKLYVNYDIEVGDTHYVKSIKYTKKLAWDMRPKIW